jgi:hypothetical protein
MSLSPETEEVLHRARLSTAMAPEQRSRLKSRILARIAATGTLLVAGNAAARGGFALWGSTMSATAKGVTALALVASLGAGGYVATRAIQRAHAPLSSSAHREPEPVRPPEPAVTTEAPAPAVEAPGVVAAPQEVPAVKGPSRPIARASATAPIPPSNTLLEETNLIKQAELARGSGNVARATALLDEHAARFPNGQMAPERAAERMVIQCQTGQAGAAAGQLFLSEHPGSPYSARIKQTCHIGSL